MIRFIGHYQSVGLILLLPLCSVRGVVEAWMSVLLEQRRYVRQGKRELKRRISTIYIKSSEGEFEKRAEKGWWQLIGTGRERNVCMNPVTKHRASTTVKILK